MVFLAFLIITMPVHALMLTEWNILIEINDDGSIDETVGIEYDMNVQRADYFVLSRIKNVEVMSEGKAVNCSTSFRDVGTSIVCENVNLSEIVYKFTILDAVQKSGDAYIFKYSFPIVQPTQNFSVMVKLPLGTVIIEKDKLNGTGLEPFSPPWGEKGSDGRKIFVKWAWQDPELAASIPISLIYEETNPIETISRELLALGVGGIVILLAAAVGFFFYFKKPHIKTILPVLTPSERKVMEVLLKEKGPVNQKKIVKETDFSKTKVSRIMKTLEERGIIERVRKGRKNIVKIKKHRGALK
jgi:biotin operon repressor